MLLAADQDKINLKYLCTMVVTSNNVERNSGDSYLLVIFSIPSYLIILGVWTIYVLLLGFYRCQSTALLLHGILKWHDYSVLQPNFKLPRTKISWWVSWYVMMRFDFNLSYANVDEALTTWYQGYFDIWLGGQYIWKIKQMHEQYGIYFKLKHYKTAPRW